MPLFVLGSPSSRTMRGTWHELINMIINLDIIKLARGSRLREMNQALIFHFKMLKPLVLLE